MEELQDNIKITIKTELNKTEDKNDLIYAMTNIVDIDYDVKDKEIIGKSTDYKKLMNLYDRLRNKQTTHIARKVLMRNSEKDMTYILFNKQAAAIDSIVICENSKESPLGPIFMKIKTENILEFIDWFVPRYKT
ncbi:MAG TPA: hypothetical protein EYO93_03015 [Nitrososphaerales archaeon]|jgi:predicted RNA binding protein with dsRBD fold (UPF0201 family)|nr:hypothetical protein [Nitrososphaerales archaeon]NSL73801.1 hypothetical protein [Nitrososphaerota archaeon]NSL74329.1 hypothetical protein [Nitrososphaerota archaeon]NSL75678.1 hypothetical protein [Nitrososphaerota archaeon]NSL77153.1 hypothetical protein [Nitrososphaerota archaeon]|tara:strand:+ start:57 stop:458 length:402 start_codon:yes stop_codon:yes gene_type:complete